MARLHQNVTQSRDYRLFVLRRLYNKDNRGKGVQGETRRVDMHTTITPETAYALAQRVPTGAGRFMSPVVELGIRMQLAVLGSYSIDTVGEEMAMAFVDRFTLAKKLRELADFVEAYTPEV